MTTQPWRAAAMALPERLPRLSTLVAVPRRSCPLLHTMHDADVQPNTCDWFQVQRSVQSFRNGALPRRSGHGVYARCLRMHICEQCVVAFVRKGAMGCDLRPFPVESALWCRQITQQEPAPHLLPPLSMLMQYFTLADQNARW